MRTVGFVAIGKTPEHDVVPEVRVRVSPDVRLCERGNLDGLSPDEVAALAPDPGEVGIVAPLGPGAETLLSHRKILPRIQRLVDELVNDERAELVVILCGADWSAIDSPVPLINPGRLFPAVVSALAHGRKLGIIKPSPGQVERERERYRMLGIDAVATSATPFGQDRLDQARQAAELLRTAGCELIWMTCIGMDEPMREIVAAVTGRPVLLARSLLASIVAQLADGRPWHQR